MYNIDVPTFSIMPNSRISDLFQVKKLDQDLDAEALLLIARAKSHNETMNYQDFKQSITDYCVFITGDQLITGFKTFEDNALFKKDVSIQGDLSVRGDIFNLRFETGVDPAFLDAWQPLIYAKDSEVASGSKAWRAMAQTLPSDEPAVEGVKSQGKFTIVEHKHILNGDMVNLVSSDGQVIGFVEGTHWTVGANKEASATNLALAIDQHELFSATSDVNSNEVIITQAITGIAGNTTIYVDTANPAQISKEDFSGGLGSASNPWVDVTKKDADDYLTQLDSNLNTQGDLTVESNSKLQGILEVDGDSDLYSKLTVHKDTLLKENLNVNGDSILDSRLSVNTTEQREQVTIHGNIGLTDGYPIRGTGVDLIVASGTSAFIGNSGALEIDNDKSAYILHDINVGRDLLVSGNAAFQQNLTVFKNLEVKEDVLIGDELEVVGTSLFKENVLMEKDLVVNNDLTVQNNLTVRGDVFNIKFEQGVDPDSLAEEWSQTGGVNLDGSYAQGDQVKYNSQAWEADGATTSTDEPGTSPLWRDITKITKDSYKTELDSDLLVEGKLGVGTDTPGQKVHIKDAVNDDVSLYIQNNLDNDGVDDDNVSSSLMLGAPSNNFALRTFAATTDLPEEHETEFLSTAYASFFTFKPGNSESLRLTTDGGVGIGTSVLNDWALTHIKGQPGGRQGLYIEDGNLEVRNNLNHSSIIDIVSTENDATTEDLRSESILRLKAGASEDLFTIAQTKPEHTTLPSASVLNKQSDKGYESVFWILKPGADAAAAQTGTQTDLEIKFEDINPTVGHHRPLVNGDMVTISEGGVSRSYTYNSIPSATEWSTSHQLAKLIENGENTGSGTNDPTIAYPGVFRVLVNRSADPQGNENYFRLNIYFDALPATQPNPIANPTSLSDFSTSTTQGQPGSPGADEKISQTGYDLLPADDGGAVGVTDQTDYIRKTISTKDWLGLPDQDPGNGDDWRGEFISKAQPSIVSQMFGQFGQVAFLGNQGENLPELNKLNAATDTFFTIHSSEDSFDKIFKVQDSADPDATPFVISSLGQVGVGTAEPSYKLTVSDDSARHLRFENGPEISFIRLLGNGDLDLWAHGGSNILFRSGNGTGVENVRITQAGNVGIATDSPSHKLVVGDDIGSVSSAEGVAVIGDQNYGGRLFLGLDNTKFGALIYNGLTNDIEFKNHNNANQVILKDDSKVAFNPNFDDDLIAQVSVRSKDHQVLSLRGAKDAPGSYLSIFSPEGDPSQNQNASSNIYLEDGSSESTFSIGQLKPEHGSLSGATIFNKHQDKGYKHKVDGTIISTYSWRQLPDADPGNGDPWQDDYESQRVLNISRMIFGQHGQVAIGSKISMNSLNTINNDDSTFFTLSSSNDEFETIFKVEDSASPDSTPVAIDKSGKTSFGHAAPTHLIHAKGYEKVLNIENSDNGRSVFYGINNNESFIDFATGDNFHIKQDGTTVFEVKNGGDLEVKNNLSVLNDLTVRGDIFNIKFADQAFIDNLPPYVASASYADGDRVQYNNKAWDKVGNQGHPQHQPPGTDPNQWIEVEVPMKDQFKTHLDSNLLVTGKTGLGLESPTSKLHVKNIDNTLPILTVEGLTKHLQIDFNGDVSIYNKLRVGPRQGLSSTNSFQIFQDDPASVAGSEQYLGFLHSSSSSQEGGDHIYIHESGKLNIGTLDTHSMLNIEQKANTSGIRVLSQPAQRALLLLQESGSDHYLQMGSAATLGSSFHDVYGTDLSYLRSTRQDLAIFSGTQDTNVHIGAGDKKLVTFTGTTDSHPVTGAEAGNDILFSEHANVGINVDKVDLSPTNNDKFKLHVLGDVKIDGRLFALDIFETFPVIPKIGDTHQGSLVERPEHSYSAGDQGTIYFDDDYVFICTQDSDGSDPSRIAWKRFAISEW